MNALVVDGGDIYAGGDFTFIGSTAAYFIAKWDGSRWLPLGSGMDNTVLALAVSDRQIYAGGYFKTAGGNAVANIAKWDGNAWSALGSGVRRGNEGIVDPRVSELAVSGCSLYAAGWFTVAGEKASAYVARAITCPLVFTTTDAGVGSLREAIAEAGATDIPIITFAPNVSGTITLASGELTIGTNMAIVGPGANVLAVNGNNSNRVFHIAGGNVEILGLKITGGNTASDGGGILVEDTLTLSNCVVTGNVAQVGGGGIGNYGALWVTGSTICSNTTSLGGGIDDENFTSVTNSTICYNSAWSAGGVSMSSYSSLTSCTVASNTATFRGGGIYTLGAIQIYLGNTIVADNASADSPDMELSLYVASRDISPGTLRIYAGEGTNGALLATASISIAAQHGFQSFSLSSQLHVDAGSQYTAHISVPSANTFWLDFASGDNPYAGGRYSGVASWDLAFKTYVIPDSGADQRGRARPIDFSGIANASGGDGSDIGAFESINNIPHLNINDAIVDELSEFAITVSASDPDVPANKLTFSLQGTPPEGATIDADSGLFHWLPSEAQGPGSYDITVRVTDDGSPALFAERGFRIAVREINSAPVLHEIDQKMVTIGETLKFTANALDSDLPPNTLSYTLADGAGFGATMETGSGVFSWTPSVADVDTIRQFSIRVVDDGLPPMSDAKTFSVIVSPAPRVPVNVSVSIEVDRVVLTWPTALGRHYIIQDSNDLVHWTNLQQLVADQSSLEFKTLISTSESGRFFRVVEP